MLIVLQYEQAAESYFIVCCTGFTSFLQILQYTDQYLQTTRVFVTYSGMFGGYIHKGEAYRILSIAGGSRSHPDTRILKPAAGMVQTSLFET